MRVVFLVFIAMMLAIDMSRSKSASWYTIPIILVLVAAVALLISILASLYHTRQLCKKSHSRLGFEG